MQPKLLQLNCTANWGSTGKIAEGIGMAAMARGWESAIAYGRKMNPSQSQLIKVGNQLDVYVHYSQHRLFNREGLGSRRPTKRLIKWIDSYEPDIIHLHNIHDHWLNYPLLFHYLATIDTQIVWTFHDCWAFTGGCAHFENAGCYKWQTHECIGTCPQKIALLANQSNRNFSLKRDSIKLLKDRLTIVGASDWITEYATESFLKGCKFVSIYNGIDLNSFKPISPVKKRMILGVSNVWPHYKGLQDFVELRRIIPDNIDICLVGLSKKQIDSLPMGIQGIERTQHIGELVNLYSEASVFVNPTHNDTFPTVNLEALACGTPVVTYRTGGSPEAVDKYTGIVVEKGNVNALADAIMMVLNNPDDFTPENCRKRAEQNFNKDIQFGKYIDLYESIFSK